MRLKSILNLIMSDTEILVSNQSGEHLQSGYIDEFDCECKARVSEIYIEDDKLSVVVVDSDSYMFSED